MTLKIERAYPLLRRQWRDKVQKIQWEGVKGAPDFLLLSAQYPPIFAEVKCVATVTTSIGLEKLQAYTLDVLHGFSCVVRLLTLCLQTERWYMHVPPFYFGTTVSSPVAATAEKTFQRVWRCSESGAEPAEIVEARWLVAKK